MTACSTRPVIPCSRCDDPDKFVYLSVCRETSDELYPAPFQHPVRLTADDWRLILASLRVQARPNLYMLSATDGPILSAFLPEEIAYLSQALSSALAQADTEQCAVFGLDRSVNGNLREVTTGAVFVRENELHMVLPNYREKTTMPGRWEELKRMPLKPTGGVFYDFIPDDYQTVREKGGRIRHLLKRDILEIAVHYKAVLSLSEHVVGDPNKPIQQTVREQLKILKQLYDDGLIPEQQYRTKIKELLDQFLVPSYERDKPHVGN